MSKMADKAAQAEAHPNRWDKSHGTYLVGQAAVDGADAQAIACEEFWGPGRLRLLVDDQLREKFDRQRYRYAQAIQGGELIDVQREAARMTLAWKTLDKAARAAGHWRRPAEVWETTLSDGTVVAIVQTLVDAKAVRTEGRQVALYSLEEIARLIEGYPGVVKAKQLWPGARVEPVRKSIADPLDAIDKATGLDSPLEGGGDPLPF